MYMRIRGFTGVYMGEHMNTEGLQAYTLVTI